MFLDLCLTFTASTGEVQWLKALTVSQKYEAKCPQNDDDRFLFRHIDDIPFQFIACISYINNDD